MTTEEATTILKASGFTFAIYDQGARIIVKNRHNPSESYDFWPKTRKWHHRTGARNGLRGNGLDKLMKLAGEPPIAPKTGQKG